MNRIWQIIIIFILFIIAGFFYNYFSPTKWKARYEMHTSESFTIYANSLEKVLLEIGVKTKADKLITDLLIYEITYLPDRYENGYKDLREIDINEKNLYVEVKSRNLLDEQVPKYVNSVNLRLKKYLEEILELYNELTVVSINEKIEFFKNRLDKIISVYSKEEVKNTIESLEKEKNTGGDQRDQTEQKIASLENLFGQIEGNTSDKYIIFQEYTKFYPSSITLQNLIDLRKEYEDKSPQDFIEFGKITRLKNNLENTDFLVLGNKIKVINHKPKLSYTLLAFGFFGLFFGSIFVYLNSPFAKRMIRKKLSFLQNLE